MMSSTENKANSPRTSPTLCEQQENVCEGNCISVSHLPIWEAIEGGTYIESEPNSWFTNWQRTYISISELIRRIEQDKKVYLCENAVKLPEWAWYGWEPSNNSCNCGAKKRNDSAGKRIDPVDSNDSLEAFDNSRNVEGTHFDVRNHVNQNSCDSNVKSVSGESDIIFDIPLPPESNESISKITTHSSEKTFNGDQCHQKDEKYSASVVDLIKKEPICSSTPGISKSPTQLPKIKLEQCNKNSTKVNSCDKSTGDSSSDSESDSSDTSESDSSSDSESSSSSDSDVKVTDKSPVKKAEVKTVDISSDSDTNDSIVIVNQLKKRGHEKENKGMPKNKVKKHNQSCTDIHKISNSHQNGEKSSNTKVKSSISSNGTDAMPSCSYVSVNSDSSDSSSSCSDLEVNTPAKSCSSSPNFQSIIKQVLSLQERVNRVKKRLQESETPNEFSINENVCLDDLEHKLGFRPSVLHLAGLRVSKEQQDELVARGVEIKRGRFSELEDSVLLNNLQNFMKQHKILQPRVLIDVNLKKDSSMKAFLYSNHFFECLAKDLDGRILYSVYLRARKLFNIDRRITSLEERFQRLESKMNKPKSAKKSPGNTYKRQWTEQEVDTLQKVVEELVSDKNKAIAFQSSLWDAVAMFIPTKTAKQCRKRWFNWHSFNFFRSNKN